VIDENLIEFANTFKNEIEEFLSVSKKYGLVESKKIIYKLDFLKIKNLGFKFIFSKTKNICACLITNNNKIEISKTNNFNNDLCKSIFSNSLNLLVYNKKTKSDLENKIFQLANSSPFFSLQNNSKLILSDTGINGTCNVADIDKTSQVLWINGKLKLPHFNFFEKIPLLYIAGMSKFTNTNAKELFLEIINLIRFANEQQINDFSQANNNLKTLVIQFEKLLLSNPKEKEIEKFIEKNFILLRIALNLEYPISQPELPEAGLKPDLIAFDFLKKEWLILDYKLSKYEKLIVGNERRKRLFSKFEELLAQLETYVEFFDDSKNRENFKNKYNIKIDKKPFCYRFDWIYKRL
jgi:hypothetical protein